MNTSVLKWLLGVVLLVFTFNVYALEITFQNIVSGQPRLPAKWVEKNIVLEKGGSAKVANYTSGDKMTIIVYSSRSVGGGKVSCTYHYISCNKNATVNARNLIYSIPGECMRVEPDKYDQSCSMP